MTDDLDDPNPFRQAAWQTWAASDDPNLPHDERDRRWRQAQWYEEEAARWDLRHGLVPAPRSVPPDERLPRRSPGVTWEALTGEPLDAHRTADWDPHVHHPTLHRMVTALRRRPP